MKTNKNKTKFNSLDEEIIKNDDEKQKEKKCVRFENSEVIKMDVNEIVNNESEDEIESEVALMTQQKFKKKDPKKGLKEISKEKKEKFKNMDCKYFVKESAQEKIVGSSMMNPKLIK